MMNRRALLHRSTLAGITALGAGSSAHAATLLRDPGPPIPDIRISLRLSALHGGELSTADYEATVNAIFNRAETLGTEAASMRTVSPDRLIIGVTGVNDVASTMTTITARGFVELVDPKGELFAPGTVIRTTAGGEPWPRWDGARPVIAPRVYETVVGGDQIAAAFKTTNQFDLPIVEFHLTEAGGAALAAFTASHIGEPLAVVVDNRVISTPIVQGIIEHEGIIEGLEPFEVDALVIQLQLEPLRARVEVERFAVDPSFSAAGGEDAG